MIDVNLMGQVYGFNKARTKLGVKPVGVPPLYQPSLVANAIFDVAEHPKREVVVGDAGKMILLVDLGVSWPTFYHCFKALP